MVWDAAHLAEDGQTDLAYGDGDGRPKIILGMGVSADLHLQGFADLNAGYAQLNVPHQRAVQSPLNAANPSSRGGGTCPSVGGWDGLDEIVDGYGAGSNGWISFVGDAQAQEYDRYSGFLRAQLGRIDWSAVNGAVRPVFANADEDDAKEIIVGFGESGSHEHQIFDDMSGGGMAFFR